MKYETKVSVGRIILFLLMFLGLFLALCSIASLSYIDQGKESAVPILVRYDTTLKKVQSTSIFGKVNISKLDTSLDKMWEQYQAFVNYKTAAPKELTKDAKKRFKIVADSLVRQFLTHMTNLSNEKNEYVMSYNKYFKAQQNILTQADEMFKQSALELPAGLLARYSEKLMVYISGLPYESEITKQFNILYGNYQLFFRALKIGDDNLHILADELKTGDTDFDLTPYTAIPELPNQQQYQIPLLEVSSKIPAPPKPGDDWGIFAVVIGWLVGPKNIDLLVLIGMLGFALFGSAITIFVTKNLNDASVSISQSITLVLVRGFSAAIIVFLAIQGGLTIINTGENKPNPILLFLFCFLGSVFSEPIWEWGRERVKHFFPSQGNAGGGGGAAGGGAAASAGANNPGAGGNIPPNP